MSSGSVLKWVTENHGCCVGHSTCDDITAYILDVSFVFPCPVYQLLSLSS